ncbi:hypothetical protein GQ43DRAFT_100057 [Delitschia confertaspora ATCC 74209]|uniref:Uncharacterized protein n=1 Tax=Delitschia confertaspora ATCC 74209 TaxID=1513339 RepID=A0A9P4JIN2_9PLEO|nr:hypothetical protein GQ43DRAFT_100057 [Delitschia confertaspora ATCC 74209]
MSSPEAYPKCPKHAGVTPAGSLAPSLGLNEPEQLRQSYSSITHTCAQPITGYSNNSGETESQRACDDDIQLVGDRHLPTSVASIQTSPQPAAAANSSQTKPRRVSSSYEECGPLKYERASNVVISITPKRESSNFGLHNLSEDTVGLPKEQYKPPPSRSRSAKPPVDLTIDYSVRPEQKAKTKAKRNRTIAVSEKPSTPTASSLLLRSQSQMTVTEESTEVLPLEGALPLKSEITSGKSTAASLDHWYTPEKSDRTNAQQMKNTEEVTITIPEEPLANMEKTEGESRPREHANDNITASKRKENSDVIGIDNFQKTEDGGKLLNGTRRKVQRSKTLGFLDSLQKEVLAAPETPKGKKRGRGRLQKSQEVPMTEPGDEVVSTNPSSTAVIQSGVSTQAKASRDTPSHTVTSMTEENPVVRPNSTPPKPDNPAQRTRPAMGDTPEKRSHSPLSKGKVPFRVGLSRRARIAPLLRIVKK